MSKSTYTSVSLDEPRGHLASHHGSNHRGFRTALLVSAACMTVFGLISLLMFSSFYGAADANSASSEGVRDTIRAAYAFMLLSLIGFVLVSVMLYSRSVAMFLYNWFEIEDDSAMDSVHIPMTVWQWVVVVAVGVITALSFILFLAGYGEGHRNFTATQRNTAIVGFICTSFVVTGLLVCIFSLYTLTGSCCCICNRQSRQPMSRRKA